MTMAALLATGSMRSRAYLQMLEASNHVPQELVFLETSRSANPPSCSAADLEELSRLLGRTVCFDPSEPLADTARRLGVGPTVVDTADINDPAVVGICAGLASSVVLVSPPSGSILREDLLRCGKSFLHLHPGELPRYRGSTTFYYSLLEEASLGCTAFFMGSRLDDGPVLHVSSRQEIRTTLDIDALLDPVWRAVALVDCLEANPSLEPRDTAEKIDDNEFYVIHPVLKHMAILQTRALA